MSRGGGWILGAIIGVVSLVVGGFAIFIGLLSGAQGGSGAKAVSDGTTIIVGGIVVALFVIWWTRGADDSRKNE